MIRRRYLIVAAIAGVGVAVAGMLSLFGRSAAPEVVRLYGNVDVRQVHLGFRVAGRLADAFVDEGDAVTPGTVLARLDRVPFQESYDLALARRDGAKAAYEKAVNGPRPAEIEQGRAAVVQRRADVLYAEQSYERAARLVKTSAVSKAFYDQALAGRDAARAQLSAAQEALILLEEGTRAEDIAAARADLGAAEADLASAATALADTDLFAPASGMVVSRVQEPGAIVGAGEIVFVVTLDEPVWVRAYVAEADLGRVFTGLRVTLHSDTEPDKPYQGVVGFVSPVAEFTPKSVETPDLRTDLVYRLRIVVENPDTGLRQGMPVTIRLDRPPPTAPE